MLLPSRRAIFCSAHNSGEDFTTTLVSLEVDDRKCMRMLAPSLLMQKRVASAAPARTLKEKVLCLDRLAFRAQGNVSHQRKSSRDSKSVQESSLEKDFSPNIKMTRLRADKAAEGE